jgi:acyl-coenzyme A synthetase/AMP-(fatty) acid ligase
MPQNSPRSLWSSVLAAGNLSSRIAVGADASAAWGELGAGSVLDRPSVELRGSSVLLATLDQFAAAAALVQLDGVARLIVLYPPDIPQEHLAIVAEIAETEILITDQPEFGSAHPQLEYVHCGREIKPQTLDRSRSLETEWVLLTSGTTGVPKLVVHTWASLVAAIGPTRDSSTPMVWSTFYDIRRYGGLQIFLRAALVGASLVLPGVQESTADFFARAGAHGVTHISGTPSHWRRALMSPSAGLIVPSYVRLSGEIADQAILNQLQLQYPQARVAHAFASTEAGVLFEVGDGLMGFPSSLIGQRSASGRSHNVELKVQKHTLRMCSNGSASRYLGADSPPLKDAEGFVDTGDALELRDGRYYFVGRRDGVINVGGLKVHPEEVESVINRHPEVRASLVRTKKNPITGGLVVADVVLKTAADGDDAQTVQREIMQFCRGELAQHKVPVAINFVSALPVAGSGKLVRPHA